MRFAYRWLSPSPIMPLAVPRVLRTACPADGTPNIRARPAPPDSRTPARSAPRPPPRFRRGATPCHGDPPSRRDPVAVPDDRHLTATTTHPTAQAQSHERALALPARHQRRQIQKGVPPAGPAERAQPVAVRVSFASVSRVMATRYGSHDRCKVSNQPRGRSSTG
jgi:hypothetical protein